MRHAILISFATFGLTWSAVRADEPMTKIDLGSRPGYIVPEAYATAHQKNLIATIPGSLKIMGFWTPTEVDVLVADRVFHELIHAAVKDPTLLFPDLAPSTDPAIPVNAEAAAQLENERYELTLVSSHYDRYACQYVGIIVDGQKLIFCNYANARQADPSTGYISVEKVFVGDGTVHFLQCRFDPQEKTCSNVSMIGSWQRSPN